MIESLAAYLGDRGCLVEPAAMAHLARQADPEAHLRALLAGSGEAPTYLTLEMVRRFEAAFLGPAGPAPAMPAPAIPSAARKGPVSLTAQARAQRALHASDVGAEVELMRDSGTGARTRGQVQDFAKYFQSRHQELQRLLRKRREVSNAVPISRLGTQGRQVQLIGLVVKPSQTPNGHLFFDLEDDTGTATLLVPASSPTLLEQARTLVPDEVVGIVAQANAEKDLLVVQEIVRPDVPYAAPRGPDGLGLSAAVLSDIHVGSRTFLPKPFAKMLKWLGGQGGSQSDAAAAARVKYLVLAGDVVDGVGIYPGQEDALESPDILDQYRQLAHLLEGLPDHVHVVIQPGNHDAVRPTEPQPPLPKEIQGLFDHVEATFVSNPSAFRLHGVDFLSYHGFSMVDFATHVPGLSMDEPLPIMRRMLQGRHLAPTYGAATPLSPEERDWLVIDRVPQVFVTGHVHVNGIENYRGITMINAGTWQEQTDYQRTHNLVPTPGRLPIVDLGSLNAELVSFSQ